MPRSLGLDIGGANLKVALADGTVQISPFEVWRHPNGLGQALTTLVRGMPSFENVAITMTAELCDCYETKTEGVIAILDAVEQAMKVAARDAQCLVWLLDGSLVTVDQAMQDPLRAAASNWLALATWAGRFCPSGIALVIDIGSTTTDIIPLQDGLPVPRGRTDPDRLATGELVYSGIARTPLHALVRRIQCQERSFRVAAELFATTRDVYLWLRELPEEPDDLHTADGRPATRAQAGSRLARLLCADRTMLDDLALDELAEQVAAAQINDLVDAMKQVERNCGGPCESVVLSGVGEFLTRRALRQRHRLPQIISVRDRFGPVISEVACAYALAVLAGERSQADGS